jgi:benzil reductase ((S)-benzoin forming)
MNKAVVITGVSSGLGQSLFDALSEHDIRLVGISRRALAQQAKHRENENIRHLRCDLSDAAMVRQCAKELVGLLADARDITFVNNAFTIEPIGLVGELDDDTIGKAIQTNVTSAIVLVNALCKLKKDAKLTFIDVTSGAANTPIAGWALYCSAKAATQMFFNVLKKQSATDNNISVYSFEPGVIDTSMQETIRHTSQSQFPRVQEFKELKRSGALRDPAVLAAELIHEYIQI